MTVGITFKYFMEEISYLGLAANYVNLKWNDFFNEAIQQQIDWVMDPKEQEEVKRIAGRSWQEVGMGNSSRKKSKFLTVNFPIEKLETLHQAAEKLQIPVGTFIGDAVLDKVENVEIVLECPEIFEKDFEEKEEWTFLEDFLKEMEDEKQNKFKQKRKKRTKISSPRKKKVV